MNNIRMAHLAVVVEDIQAALNFWQDALGLELTEVRDVPAEAARIAFLPLGNSVIELVQPTTADSGMAKFLSKRGSGMHHICLEVDNIDEVMAVLKEKGVRLIHEEPLVGANGQRYAFIHPQSATGVLVELYCVAHHPA